MSDVEVLLQLSKAETDLIKAQKALNEIPEAAQIMDCRNRRKELKAKQDQVYELTDEVNAKIAQFEAEEAKLIEKMKDLQDTLDHNKDFRLTASITRDMEGLVKRQGTISQEVDALLERQIKIDHLGTQVSDMLQKLDQKEHMLTHDFKAKGSAAKAVVDEAAARRDDLLAQLPADLQKRYAKIKAEKNGIAVATLTDGYCSVCRTQIQTGQMQKLKAGPDVSECPNCHRIFLVRV